MTCSGVVGFRGGSSSRLYFFYCFVEVGDQGGRKVCLENCEG